MIKEYIMHIQLDVEVACIYVCFIYFCLYYMNIYYKNKCLGVFLCYILTWTEWAETNTMLYIIVLFLLQTIACFSH